MISKLQSSTDTYYKESSKYVEETISELAERKITFLQFADRIVEKPIYVALTACYFASLPEKKNMQTLLSLLVIKGLQNDPNTDPEVIAKIEEESAKGPNDVEEE